MIASMSLSQVKEACQGCLYGKDVRFNRVVTDSRDVKKGDLYLALKGERFDGNAYASDACSAGAVGTVLSDLTMLKSSAMLEHNSVLHVPDTRYALGKIAGHCRKHFSKPVIAITGSSGKTTTRKMLGAILSERGAVCMTAGNQNNEIGVPLTLLDLQEGQSAAVIEIGARKVGDINYLGEFVQPDISLLLNAGLAHVGEFGSYQNIVRAKSEIYSILKPDGLAVVNLDDKASAQWLDGLKSKRVITYSCANLSRDDHIQADVTAANICVDSKSSRFDLCFQGESEVVFLPAAGEHNVANALAAAAAAIAVGVSLSEIVKGLASYQPERGRLHFKSENESLTWIDDSYNANPVSMLAALRVLAEQNGRRIAVLGEMGELGNEAETYHLKLADEAAHMPIDRFYLIGPFAKSMADIIGAHAFVKSSKADIARALKDDIKGVSVVLLKGSRSAAMEEVANLLQEVEK